MYGVLIECINFSFVIDNSKTNICAIIIYLRKREYFNYIFLTMISFSFLENTTVVVLKINKKGYFFGGIYFSEKAEKYFFSRYVFK